MSIPFMSLPLSQPIPSPLKRKRVLLIDTSSSKKRDLRAEIMRRLGMDVDCAADISEARSWWRADLYNLVLINSENEQGRRDKFCDDVREAIPRQQLAFLVGKPEYLSASPTPEDALLGPNANDLDPRVAEDIRAALTAEVSGGPPQRWGILEACRRISAVRTAADARSKAIRERPAPVRDSEAPRSNRPPETDRLSELLGKELQ